MEAQFSNKMAATTVEEMFLQYVEDISAKLVDGDPCRVSRQISQPTLKRRFPSVPLNYLISNLFPTAS